MFRFILRWKRLCVFSLVAAPLVGTYAQETDIGKMLEESLDRAREMAYALPAEDQPEALEEIVTTIGNWITGFLALTSDPEQNGETMRPRSFYVDLLYGCHLGEQFRIRRNWAEDPQSAERLAQLTRSVIAGYPASLTPDNMEAFLLVLLLAQSKEHLGDGMAVQVRQRLAEGDLDDAEKLPLHIVLEGYGIAEGREWLAEHPLPFAEKLRVLFQVYTRQTTELE